MPTFNYVRQALTLDGFETYCRSYDFGKVPPDYIVLHHTAIPDASWATVGNDPRKWWDRNEAGLSVAQIRDKRLAQLDGLKNHYQNTLGWDAGPHLFVDDRFIYLMTPMYDVGVHASFGNSFKRGGKLHYSIGIEVIGDYSRIAWPASVQAMVRGAVGILQRRLGTFTLDYMYADGGLPGSILVKDGDKTYYKARYPDRLRFGGISSHRDYNKPSCPGNAVTNAFYMQVLRGGMTYRRGATLRREPSRSSEVLRVSVSERDPVTLLDTVHGEPVNGVDTWYFVQIGNTNAYVHKSGVND